MNTEFFLTFERKVWFGVAETGFQHLNTGMGKLLIAPAKEVFTVSNYSDTHPGTETGV